LPGITLRRPRARLRIGDGALGEGGDSAAKKAERNNRETSGAARGRTRGTSLHDITRHAE